MRTVLAVELAVAVVAWAVFIVDYWRSRWWSTAAGRQLMATACVALGEAASFSLLIAGVRVPVWVFVIGFGAADVVVISWVVLRWRARRSRLRATSTDTPST
jgi:hypothetical protein